MSLNPSDHLGLLFLACRRAWLMHRGLSGTKINEPEELWGYAYSALDTACRNFDPGRNLKPSTLLYGSAFGAARNGAKILLGWKLSQINKAGPKRNPRPYVLECEARRRDEVHSSGSWLEALARDGDEKTVEHLEVAAAALALLGEPYLTVIRDVFWRNRTMSDIGEDLGMSRANVEQIKRKALDFLRRVLSRRGRIGNAPRLERNGWRPMEISDFGQSRKCGDVSA